MKRGMTLVELLTALVLGIIILGALYAIYTTAVKSYTKTSKSSNLQEQVRTVTEQLDFLFSRWGFGVPYDPNGTSCSSYPPKEFPSGSGVSYCYVLNGSSDITFYGSLGGSGMVVDTQGNSVSCRLNSNKSQNCYYVWRKGILLDDDNNPSTPPPVYSISVTPNNADCINLSCSNNVCTNATVSSGGITLQPGDVLIRVPHRIRVYLQGNTLYMDLTDMAANCNANEISRPIANNVDLFEVSSVQDTPYPVLMVRLRLKDPSTGQTYEVIRYYGRR